MLLVYNKFQYSARYGCIAPEYDKGTATLRNEQFFSLAELNHAIRDKIELFNHRFFQKKESSRLGLFLW